MNQTSHWEDVYRTKAAEERSWTQAVPEPSLSMIVGLDLPRSAPIIDIGGGDSRLVDALLDAGFHDVTVLDISQEALSRAQERLGERAQKVRWIVADITTFTPERHYALWHDRAVFHFLTDRQQIQNYVAIASTWTAKFLVLGTFSIKGPRKCSGLEVTQYSAESLSERFSTGFKPIECFSHNHQTPFGTTQDFVFCLFAKQP